MTNDLTVPDNFGQVADVFKDVSVDASRFTAGIGMAWPILTLKGKTWGWRFRGIDHAYTAPNAAAGGAIMAVQFLDVVLVDAGQRISKVYYKAGYKDGERTNPDCWSADGITPDPGASEKQANTCRGCQWNVFGSRMGDGGQKGKACSDNKRLAIVTTNDLKNTDFGGPFMLRLPPGSFSNYSTYVSVMASRGFHPFQIVTRLMFDPQAAHPKVMFSPVRPLTSPEALIVVEHMKNPRTAEMLNDKAIGAFADPDAMDEGNATPPTSLPTPDTGTPSTPANGGWTTPAAATTPAAPAKPAPAPAPAPVLTPEQLEIQALKAKLAEAEKVEAEPPPPPKPAPVLTPEQLEIQQLKAKLAEAEAAKKKPGRPRSKPVAPPETGTTGGTPAGNGVSNDPPEAISDVGNAIAARIASMVGKTQ